MVSPFRVICFKVVLCFLLISCSNIQDGSNGNNVATNQGSKESIESNSKVEKKTEKETTDSIEKIQSKTLVLKCMDYSKVANELVIRNNKEYQELLSNKVNVKQCKNYDLPTIDFTKQLLLGKKTNVAGCQTPTYKREVHYNKNSNVVNYHIKVKQNGNCKRAWISMNWVIIEEPNQSSRIDYSVIKKQAK